MFFSPGREVVPQFDGNQLLGNHSHEQEYHYGNHREETRPKSAPQPIKESLSYSPQNNRPNSSHGKPWESSYEFSDRGNWNNYPYMNLSTSPNSNIRPIPDSYHPDDSSSFFQKIKKTFLGKPTDISPPNDHSFLQQMNQYDGSNPEVYQLRQLLIDMKAR